MKKLELAIYASAVALAVSLFLPITRIPVLGNVSYYRMAEMESYLIIGLCVIAGALLVAGKARWTLLNAAGIWLILLYPAIREAAQPTQSNLLSEVTDKASRVMTEFAADLFLNLAEFSWGGFVFLAALASFTLFSIVRCFK